VSAVGQVRYERAYYFCRHCRHGATPADATLQVDQSELTPAARELAALAGTLSSFAEAAEKVLPKAGRGAGVGIDGRADHRERRGRLGRAARARRRVR